MNTRVAFCLALGFVVLSSAGAAAQEYRLGPEDELDVVVYGEPQLTTIGKPNGLIVGPDGVISFPIVGEIKVEGLTTRQVRDEIVARLVDRGWRDPQVSVSVRRYRQNRVFVLGEVGSPGVYDLKPGWGVKEALAAAGGLGSQARRASLRGAVLIRPDHTVIRLDLQAILSGDPAARVLLQPGDTIVVQQESTISVLGEVRMPGYFEVRDGERITEAIARAGGADPSTADLRAVLLQRLNGPARTIDVQAILEGKNPEDNVVLQPGDVIFVPEARNEVLVLGALHNPGRKIFREGDRVVDAIALAGGALVEGGEDPRFRPADLEHVTLKRRDGTVLQLNIERVIAQGRVADEDNPLLKRGDIVIVPPAINEVAVLGHVRNPGRYRFVPGDRVSDAVARAGGVIRPTMTPPDYIQADLEHVTFQRRGEKPVTINLAEILAGRAQEQNFVLQPGDTIIVPRARNEVAVLGFVRSPGYFEFVPGQTVAEAVAMAGGAIIDRADLENVAIHRQGQIIKLNLKSALEGKDGAKDVALQPGDTIVVPELRRQVAVLGHVQNPGYYTFKDGDRVSDAIAMAGGAVYRRGSYYHVALIREVEGKQIAIDVDLGKVIHEGRTDLNIPLKHGDILFVPKSKPFFSDEMFRGLGAVSVLTSLLGL